MRLHDYEPYYWFVLWRPGYSEVKLCLLTRGTNNMTHHTAKSWTEFFQAIKRGAKTHDLRYDVDRNFAVGDTIELLEYDPFKGVYSGDACNVTVTYTE